MIDFVILLGLVTRTTFRTVVLLSLIAYFLFFFWTDQCLEINGFMTRNAISPLTFRHTKQSLTWVEKVNDGMTECPKSIYIAKIMSRVRVEQLSKMFS